MRMSLYELAPDLTVASAELESDICGLYFDDMQLILIDRRLPYDAKKCVLVHELSHWAHGDADDAHYGYCERRARMMAADALIDVDQFARAESMFDGDAFLMADELGVTCDVIDDYRELLRCGGVPVGMSKRQVE